MKSKRKKQGLTKMQRVGKISLLFALCSFLFLTSCSQEEDFAPQDGKDTPITIASVGVSDAVATRVETGDYTGDMYVTIKSNSNSTNAKYNSSDIKWTVEEGIATIDANETPTLYTGKANDQTLWAFTTDVDECNLPIKYTSWLMSALDYCYYKQSLSNPTVDEITMKHLFSKVTVIAEAGTEISGELQFGTMSDGDGITLTGLLSKVDIDRTYTSTPLSDAGGFDAETKMYYSGYEDDRVTRKRSYFNEALLFPSPEQKEIGIRVKQTIDGVERYFTTTFTLSEGIQSGYHYTVNLKVGKDRIEVTSVTISGEPWDENGWGTESEEVELK